MGNLRVTIDHGGNSSPDGIFICIIGTAILFVLAANAQVWLGAIGAAIAVCLYVLTAIVGVCVLTVVAVKIHAHYRDRPLYEAIQRDTESNLRAYRAHLARPLQAPPQPPPLKAEATRAPNLTRRSPIQPDDRT